MWRQECVQKHEERMYVCVCRPFMGLLPAWVLDMTAITMLGTMLPFFVEYVVEPHSVIECSKYFASNPSDKCETDSTSKLLPGCRPEKLCKNDSWVAIGLVLLMSASILSMPVWLACVKKFTKRPVWLAFNLVTAVTGMEQPDPGKIKNCVMKPWEALPRRR
eukprot:gene22573-biopygen1938